MAVGDRHAAVLAECLRAHSDAWKRLRALELGDVDQVRDAADEDGIVNISSVFGMISIPTESAHNASKFGVRGFTDALRIELEIDDCGVSSTATRQAATQMRTCRSR